MWYSSAVSFSGEKDFRSSDARSTAVCGRFLAAGLPECEAVWFWRCPPVCGGVCGGCGGGGGGGDGGVSSSSFINDTPFAVARLLPLSVSSPGGFNTAGAAAAGTVAVLRGGVSCWVPAPMVGWMAVVSGSELRWWVFVPVVAGFDVTDPGVCFESIEGPDRLLNAGGLVASLARVGWVAAAATAAAVADAIAAAASAVSGCSECV